MRIDSSGRVGIGTSSPSSFFSGASQLVVGSGSSDQGMTIYSGTTDNAQIFFADGTSGADAYRGILRYIHGDNAMTFYTDGANERMRIDSSGNLLVGTTLTPTNLNATSTEEGMAIGGDGLVVIANDGQSPLVLNRLSSDGNILNFNKDGSTVGSIKSHSSGNFLFSGTNGRAIYDCIIRPDIDDVRDIGEASFRFDNIRATNGTIQTSDQNEKNTITDSDLGIDFIKRLTPKSYIFNGKTRTHYGLIAQDVETVLTDINKPTSGFAGFIKDDISEEQDGSDYRYGLRYTEFVAPLIQAVKDQQAIIDALTARITALENGE